MLVSVVCLLSLCAGRAHAQAPAPRRNTQASELEQRLLAPCCWTQTLDIHDSELVSSLRKEIRSRLGRGEAPAAIEDDFVRRFGERVRAVPKGRDPRTTVPTVVGLLMLSTIAALFRMVWRAHTRASVQRAEPRDEEAAEIDAYDKQLAEELARVDRVA